MMTLTTTRRSPRRPRRSGGMPRAAERDRLARLRAGGDLQLARPVERRHLDRRAERGERCRHVDDRDEVVAVAHEALVLAHPHHARTGRRRAAALARVAAARDPDPLPVGDPGRDVDLRACAAPGTGRAPSQVVARLLRDAPVAAAGVADAPCARAGRTAVRGDALELARAAAALAAHDRRARLGAVAVAVLAARDGLVLDLDLAPRARRRRGRSATATATSPPCAAPPRRPPPPNRRTAAAAAEERARRGRRRSRSPRSRLVAAERRPSWP